MGPRLTHPAVPSHNNGPLRGRSCKLSHQEKKTHFPKISPSDQDVKNSLLDMET